MRIDRRIHLRGHPDTPLARRQLGIIHGVTAGLLPGLGLGNTHTNNPSPPTQPPGQTGGNTPAAPTPNIVATPVNGGPNPTGTPEGGGGGGEGNRGGGNSGSSIGGNTGTPTTANPANTPGPATRTQPIPSGTQNVRPSTGGTISNNRPSGTGFDSTIGTVNVGNGSPDPDREGLSDLTSGTGTSGDPSGSSPSNTVSTLGEGKTSTPKGPIAAAVILSLLFAVAVVIIILRKRSSTRRDELAINWWFTRNRTSRSYGDNEALNPGTSSRRSSFATTLDHSKASFLPDSAIPPPPPMAEIGRSIGTDPSLVLDICADEKRFSIGSANSHNSQFLVVHHRESLQHEHSVTGCTESFPFPKPPPADHTLYSKACEGSRSPKKREFEAKIASPTSVRSTSPQIQPTFINPFADSNPFDDPAHPPASASGTSLEVETVRHPFIPQMHDELEVDIGDSVRIVHRFDDGWVFVEKIPGGEQGLIPLNCLLYLGQNSTLGGKRMSSQGAKI
jgi:hypothetical protein